nr:immunoglobulin light chain junction region [Macaca mulatta]
YYYCLTWDDSLSSWEF